MKKKIYRLGKNLVALLAIICSAQAVNAQVGIGINTPDPSAQLQIESANKGLLIPRVNSTGDVTAPATGLMVYQTGGMAGFYYNSGSPLNPGWVKVATGSAGVADSSITNVKVAPDAAIAYSKLNLYNSVANGDITANAITTSKVANGTVTTSKLADSAVSGLKLLTYAVNNRHIANSAVTPSKIDPTGATSGQALVYNGTAVTWATPSGGTTPMFSVFMPALSTAASTQLGGWTVTSPYYGHAAFNSVTGNFTVPATGRYQINAMVNYSTTAAVTISQGAGINPAFVVRRTSPSATDLATGAFPIMDVNIALVLTLRTILGTAAVPVSATVELNAGDVIGLFYEADGLTIPLTLGGNSDQGITWSITRVQ